MILLAYIQCKPWAFILKGHIVSVHEYVHNLYMSHLVRKSNLKYLLVWTLVSCIILCLGDYKVLLIHDIDDQNAMSVKASKDTHVAFLDLNLQYHQAIQLIQKVYLTNMLKLDDVALTWLATNESVTQIYVLVHGEAQFEPLGWPLLSLKFCIFLKYL